MKHILALALGLSAVSGVKCAEPLTPARVAELRGQIRANFFVPNPLPALEAKTHRRFAPAPGVVAEAVTYATELGTRVPAILYLPDPLPKGGKIPGFIVVNGHGGDKYSWYAYYTGIAYARAGAAVLTYDQAGEGERSRTRKSGTREHDALKGDEQLARRLCGLMLTDLFQAVSYLAARPEVDASRIGAGGYSMGSFVLALAGAVAPRLRLLGAFEQNNVPGAAVALARFHQPRARRDDLRAQCRARRHAHLERPRRHGRLDAVHARAVLRGAARERRENPRHDGERV